MQCRGWATCVGLVAWALSQPGVSTAAGLQWSGYGSLSAYRAAISGAALRPDLEEADTAQRGEWRADGDSRLALQGRWLPGEATEAVFQWVSSNRLDGGYRPKVEWAYLNWQLGDALNLRVGRQTLPVLRHSETRNVGFAQVGVRPNPAVYALSTGSPVDGANLSWELGDGDGSWRMDVGIGRSSATIGRARVDVRHAVVSALQWQSTPWTARVAAAAFQMDIDGEVRAAANLQPICLNCEQAFAQRVSTQGVRARLYSAMLVWDSHPWEVAAEIVWRADSSSVLVPRAAGGYVQLSRRFGDWRLHTAVGRSRYLEPTLGLQAHPESGAVAQGQLDLIDRYLRAPLDLANLQFGVRVDLSRHVAAKLQHEFWRAPDRTTARNALIVLRTPPTGTEPATWNGRAQLTTLSLDFVF